MPCWGCTDLLPQGGGPAVASPSPLQTSPARPQGHWAPTPPACSMGASSCTDLAGMCSPSPLVKPGWSSGEGCGGQGLELLLRGGRHWAGAFCGAGAGGCWGQGWDLGLIMRQKSGQTGELQGAVGGWGQGVPAVLTRPLWPYCQVCAKRWRQEDLAGRGGGEGPRCGMGDRGCHP